MPNPVGLGLPNEASTTSNGDGTVTDHVTGLVWEETENSGDVDWQGAIDYCAALDLGGYDDWRAPSRVEMTSIVDFSQGGAKVDPAAFPDAPGAWHRTASVWILTLNGKSSLDVAWTFNLSDGIVSNNFNRSDDGRVRCVRSEASGEAPEAPAVAPPEQYTLLSDDEAQDNYTGLVWQRHDSAAYLSWDEATEYCAALNLGSHEWRLPSIRELATLVDEAQVAPAINREVFPGTIGKSKSNDWYWASHKATGSDAAWAINFDDGFTGFNAGQAGAWNAFDAGYARCVR